MYYSLSKREIDILITVQKPTAGNVIVRKLADYRLGLFASKEYLSNHTPLKKRTDLRNHKLVGYIEDLLFDNDLRFMDEIVPELSLGFKSSTVMAQMNAVAAGAGIGVIPYFMAHGVRELEPVLPEVIIDRSYWLQVNPDSRHLARVRTTMDFLVNQVKADSSLFLNPPS